MSVRYNDQWYEAPCISDSWGKFQIMFIMFAEPPLGWGWGGPQPQLNKGPPGPG
jgi:hypothetical protein